MIEYPISLAEHFHFKSSQVECAWNDRVALQAKWSLKEKGWNVAVQWKETPFGTGVFADETICAGTVLRVGINGRNLLQFKCRRDVESFCKSNSEIEYQRRLNYVKDYLWGFSSDADERGYPFQPKTPIPSAESPDNRFYGMWVPGNGLNHNTIPNTVYRTLSGGTDHGIVLVALTNIKSGEELFDDYTRHGTAPTWLSEFAHEKNVTLNFADCNNFVSWKPSK